MLEKFGYSLIALWFVVYIVVMLKDYLENLKLRQKSKKRPK